MADNAQNQNNKEKNKERLKKLGKIALGLGALGAAGAGTYYAAKNGMFGLQAKKMAGGELSAGEHLQDAMNDPIGKMKEIGSGISDRVSKGWDTTKKFVSDASDRVAELRKEYGPEVEKALNSAKETASQIGSSLKEKGSQFADFVKEKTQQGMKDLNQKIQDVNANSKYNALDHNAMHH